MNFKEWMYPLLLAMSVTFLIQYFFGSRDVSEKNIGVSGQSFIAPELEKAQKPLNFTVDFIKEDEKSFSKHVVATDLATYTFSSKGAVLESLDFTWQNGSKQVSMLANNSECFLVGLQSKTPLHYDFVKEYALDGQSKIAVEYASDFKQGVVKKTFVIHKDTYQIDVHVALDYHQKDIQSPEQVRLFFPMPISIDDSSEDVRVFKNKANRSNTVSLQDIDMKKQANEFVLEPKAFGFSNKFITQSFIRAESQYPLRGYFKLLQPKIFDAILESQPFEKDGSFTWSFYFGPKTAQAMSVVEPYLLESLDYGWLAVVAKPMLLVLTKFKEALGNYGWAIILLTLLLKLFLLPFTLKGEKSMRKQGEIQKKMAYLKQKYKHDKAALDRATAELIQKHGVPGVSGCLPMLLNIPFFISLSRILSGSIELYGASFLWLPDLSAKDPYYILGVLTGICMLLTPSPGADSKQAMFRYGSALFLGTITTYFSSGLALFIFTNTFLGLLQSWITKLPFRFPMLPRG